MFDPRDARAWTVHLGDPPPRDLSRALGAGSFSELLVSLPTHGDGRLRVDDRELDFADLPSAVARVAAGLDDAVPGARSDVVMVVLGSSLELVLVYLAVVSSGGAVVLANPTSTLPELRGIFDVAGPRAVVVDDTTAPRAGELGAPTLLASTLLASTLVGHGAQPAALGDRSDDVAIVGFTSGTTGRPKAVPLRQRHLLASIRGAASAWRIGETDHIVHALPLFHQHGLSAIHAMLTTGCSVTIATSFSADLLDLAAAAEATVLFAVPAMYARLVDDPRFDRGALPGLRLAVSGSAPLPVDLFERIEDRLGMPPLERYGTTESGLDVSNPLHGERIPGSVGLPLPGVELRIRNERGEDLVDGAAGEICLRGPQVFDGYQGEDDVVAASWWPDGWFRTGDVGVRSASGVITIVGRVKELIVSGGMNVYPAEVERALAEHPDVVEVAVVGRSSQRWGEEVVAHVVAAAPIDEVALLSFCRERLAPYKCPKAVFFVEEIPRNPMGKITRSALRTGS